MSIKFRIPLDESIIKTKNTHKKKIIISHTHTILSRPQIFVEPLSNLLSKISKKCRVVPENPKRRRATPQMMRHWVWTNVFSMRWRKFMSVERVRLPSRRSRGSCSCRRRRKKQLTHTNQQHTEIWERTYFIHVIKWRWWLLEIIPLVSLPLSIGIATRPCAERESRSSPEASRYVRTARDPQHRSRVRVRFDIFRTSKDWEIMMVWWIDFKLSLRFRTFATFRS